MSKVINFYATKKQKQALVHLFDNSVSSVLFGGSAGGGKSTLISVWLIIMCLKYPGTRYLLGRAELKALKQSTLLTLLAWQKKYGLVNGKDYTYRPIDAVLSFSNGSEIYLKDLKQNPSDPEFDDLGSTEFTAAAIDEASQVTEKAKNIVLSRLRYKHTEYGLVPKLLVASNPAKNWMYFDYYKPAITGSLAPGRVFVPALPDDNPYLTQAYLENLAGLDNVSRQRLLYGNWEYLDDDTKLINYDAILDMFSKPEDPSTEVYLTCDVARLGSDKTEVMLWRGLHLARQWSFAKQDTRETQKFLESLEREFRVPRSHVAVDEDGVGGGVVDNLPGCKGFVNNKSPYLDNGQKTNFKNLKSQCYYKLAEYINQHRISVTYDITLEDKDALIQELEQVRRHKPDDDGKVMVLPKDKVKENIGRSPDKSDCMMMRMLFELDRFVPTWLDGGEGIF